MVTVPPAGWLLLCTDGVADAANPAGDQFGQQRLSARKQMRRWNRGDIYLAEVPERIASVLELAGVASLFRVYDTTTAAIGDW